MHWAKSLEFNLQRTLHYINAAAEAGSQVVLFPEANLTSYYFPFVVELDQKAVVAALKKTCAAARENDIWVIAGTICRTADRYLNLAHVINPAGDIVYEYAKVNMAGRDEQKYCRGGNKLALFEVEGVLCTLVICRDGRHPELYRIPAMAGAQILSSPLAVRIKSKRSAGNAPRAVPSSLLAPTRRYSTAWPTPLANLQTASRHPAAHPLYGSRTVSLWWKRDSIRKK